MKPTRSHGRQSARPSLKPRALMQDAPDYADVWQARIVTLFPDLFPGVLGASLTGKALQDGRWQLHTHDLREFGIGKHRNVDDTPAGGGARPSGLLELDAKHLARDEPERGRRSNDERPTELRHLGLPPEAHGQLLDAPPVPDDLRRGDLRR